MVVNGKRVTMVEVEWADAAFTHLGWDTVENYMKQQHTSTCWSVGYLLDDDEDEVRLVMNASADSGNVGEGMTIPTKWIKAIHELVPVEKKERKRRKK